jgi:phosphate transport system substrate-binding protein
MVTLRTPPEFSKYFLLLLLVFLFSCGKPDPSETNTETATNGTLEVVADEQLRPAVDSLVKGFIAENPQAKLTVRYETSGQAIQDLLSQKARIILISRFLSPEARELVKKNNLVLPEYDIAEDAVACIVASTNPLESISMGDLKRITRNETTKWSAVQHYTGTLPAKSSLHRIMGPYSSSIEFLLDSLFLDPHAMQKGDILRFSSTDSVIAAVQKDPSAIGFISAAWLHQALESNSTGTGDTANSHNPGIKALSIIPADSSVSGVTKPIMLHLAYIYQGLYPLTSRVNGYSFENPNSLPRGFLAYAMTAHGQAIFKNFDVLPRTQIIKLVPSK